MNKRIKIGLTLLSLMLLFLTAACSSKETDILESGRISFDDVLGFSGYYEDEISPVDEWTNRTYFAVLTDGSLKNIAESFGFDIDDNLVDIDGDGKTELLCNCTSGANSHEELFVFKRVGETIKIGYVNWLRLDWEDLDYWGCNAVYTRYNSKINQIEILYCSTDENEEHHKSRTAGFDVIDYVDWNPRDIFPSIDEELAFELYSDTE